MCPPGCHHNGFMATPELGHRMYGYTYTTANLKKTQYMYIVPRNQLYSTSLQLSNVCLLKSTVIEAQIYYSSKVVPSNRRLVQVIVYAF